MNEVLQQLLIALDHRDVQTTYSRLDLLWARLAVHIRAEHLHLFPLIASTVSEAQPVIDQLRDDHDFFMRELARAIAILRELPKTITTVTDHARLAAVGDTVREVAKLLAIHNSIEENKIYFWSSTVLNESEQSGLLARINAELENRPPRFSKEAWQMVHE